MKKYTRTFALLGLLFITSSCRHSLRVFPQESHEEALPVSSLPNDEFSKISPRQGRR